MHAPQTRPLTARAGRRLALVAALAAIAACVIPAIAEYDAETEQALVALQQRTDRFVSQLARSAPSPANAFARHARFYTDIDKQLRVLERRVASIPANEESAKLVANIRASVLGEGRCSAEGASLRDLHCLPSNAERGPSRIALEISQRNVSQTIGAALALERSKQRSGSASR
jgi:hypothetical protein